MTCSSAYHKISLYNVASRSCALVVLDLFLDYRCLYYTLPLDHPHSCYFKTSFKTEYSVLVIEILSFIFTSLASIFIHISPSSQQPLGPTHIFYTPTPSPSSHPLSLSSYSTLGISTGASELSSSYAPPAPSSPLPMLLPLHRPSLSPLYSTGPLRPHHAPAPTEPCALPASDGGEEGHGAGRMRTMCGSRTGGWSLPGVMSD
jgi:hypothetical protein